MTDDVSIGFVTGSISRLAGGLFHSVRRLAHSLEQNNLAVKVLAPSDPHSADDILAWDPLQVDVFKRVGPATLGIGYGLKRRILECDLQIVHQHGLWQHPSLAVSAWRRRTSRPVVISPRGMLDPWALSHSGWKKRLAGAAFENENLGSAACLHALNASEARSMRKYGLTNPIAIIPNGTDLPELDRRPERPSWFPSDGRRTLLFLGRLHEKKGLTELVQAWALLRRVSPTITSQWKLVIGGWDDGGYMQQLQRQIAVCGLTADEVFLAGPLYGEHKEAALASADVFILPSKSEGLPMAVLEAWSWGLPVLMTVACNLPEGFSAGAAIEIPQTSSDLARVLHHALSRDDLVKIGQFGRRLVESAFGWPRIAEQHVAVYQWLLGQRNAPACVFRSGIDV